MNTAEGAEGSCGRLGGGEGEVHNEITPLARGGEGLVEVAGQVLPWGGVDSEG